MRIAIGIGHLGRIGLLVIAGAAMPALAAAAPADRVVLADNDTVLAAWQQSAGGAQPELVKQDDGGTKIEWHGGVTLDRYTDSVSGGTLLTPMRSGSYYKADIHSDLRAITPDGDTAFAQFSLTNTNDRSVLSSHDSQINSLVIGRSGQDYDFRFGDTSLDLSRLAGSTGGMRGVQAQRRFGTSTVVSVADGVLTPSWEELDGAVPRTQYLRHAYAMKLEQGIGDATRLFVTHEGYSDDPNTIDSSNALLTAASASLTTAGFNYQRNNLSVSGEAATSRWQEKGQNAHDSRAYAVDATWSGQSYGLYGGYHDTGVYYASLPGQAAPGIRETFVGGNWSAASWLALNLDLRRSQNRVANAMASGSSTLSSTRTDTVSAQQSITFGQRLPGLSLGLRQSVSNIKNSDGSSSRTAEYGANVSYSGQRWTSGIGYDLNRIDNALAPQSAGRTQTWTANLGANLEFGGDASTPPAWTASMNLTGTLQSYKSGLGTRSNGSSYGLQMHVQRGQWFVLDANYSEAFVSSPLAGGPTVRTRTYSVSAAHPFGAQNAIRFYLNNNGTISGAANQLYSEKQVGAELVYQL